MVISAETRAAIDAQIQKYPQSGQAGDAKGAIARLPAVAPKKP